MEIRDPVHGSIELNESEVKILDSLAYQRLRAIKQLGFSEFSFPGATHNRYLHSIGVAHLAGHAFDCIFAAYPFQKMEQRVRLRQVLRLAALLHDIGHGPLSHTTEEVMPKVGELRIGVYKTRKIPVDPNRQANHEDYTIKFITDSSLTAVLQEEFKDISPIHIACLIDKYLECPDDFFRVGEQDFRIILSQIVSSELDADRMDYLERDAYFCGTNYGKVELSWLLTNLAYHPVDEKLHLALNRRALYTFDDFILARHHMHLMVYFHHKSIIFEELLYRYLISPDCSYKLPSNIEEYIRFTDYALYEHLRGVSNPWARRIAERRPYKMLFELHSTKATERPELMAKELENHGLNIIWASSQTRLSKYHSAQPEERAFPIWVVDQYDRQAKPDPLEESTQIFSKYEEIRRIDRLYAAPEEFAQAESLILLKKL